MGQQIENKSVREDMESKGDTHASLLVEINALTTEIVDLYYDQIFSETDINTPSAVCKAFSDILQRHWNLSCMVIYLRGEEDHLKEIAVCGDDHLSESKASRVG